MKLPFSKSKPTQELSFDDPAFIQAKAFFDTRKQLVDSLSRIDQQAAAVGADSDAMLSAGQDVALENLPEQLAANESRLTGLRRMRIVAQGRLDAHDEGIEEASTRLTSAILSARETCVSTAKTMLKTRMGTFIFDVIAALPAQHRKHASEAIEFICDESEIVRKERARHFILDRLPGVSREAFLALVPAYFREIDLCLGRFAEIREMWDGKRDYSADLVSVDEELLRKMFHVGTGKTMREASLPERLKNRERHLAAYDCAREATRNQSRLAFQSFLENALHPDDERNRGRESWVSPEERKLSGVN